MRTRTILFVAIWIAGWQSVLYGQPPETALAAVGEITTTLQLLEKSTAVSRKERQCFTCHHQAVPTLALVAARQRGAAVDGANLAAQLEHTSAHLARGLDDYRKGKGQGGRVDTAGYALWTLAVGDWPADETTKIVCQYILSEQSERGNWPHTSNRPPSEASDFTTTYLALYALLHYGTDDQQADIETAVAKASQWLLSAEVNDTEDRVFQLRGLIEVGGPADRVQAAVEALQALQREDGGWSQTADLESDAYATATALVALSEAGVARDSDCYRRGVQFLLQQRREDGSWHVVSRSKPFQIYFESGFPHGKDQFISIAATSWALMALLDAH